MGTMDGMMDDGCFLHFEGRDVLTRDGMGFRNGYL
jgi:hypothetical protein